MSAATNSQAAAVSRALRKGGLSPLGSGTSRMREGIRVMRGWTSVRVGIDVDNAARARELLVDAREILEAAGYAVEETESGALSVRRA